MGDGGDGFLSEGAKGFECGFAEEMMGGGETDGSDIR